MKKLAPLFLLLAVVVHVAMLVGWRWQYPVVPYFFDATVLSGGRGLDFYSIYQAGYNARYGRDIYENDPAKAPSAVPYATPYRYLPIVAYTAGAALSLVSPLTAYKLWVVVIELALLACVVGAWRATRDRPLAMCLAALWLAFTPFYLELFMGQFSMVQAMLIAGLLWLSAPPGAHAPAPVLAGGLRDGLWIASILWKINTLVFAPVFLGLRRFRALAGAALLVALTTLPYFLIFPAHALDLLRNNFGGSVSTHELGNLGFRQLAFEFASAAGASSLVQTVIQYAILGAVLGICLWFTFPTRLTLGTVLPPSTAGTPRLTFQAGRLWLSGSVFAPAQAPMLLCLWLTGFFLVSPQIWEHHYVMLLPALTFAFAQAWNKPQARVVFLLWLLIALPTPFGFIGLQPQIAANHGLRSFLTEPVWQPLLEHASKAVPAGLFFGYLAAQLRAETVP